MKSLKNHIKQQLDTTDESLRALFGHGELYNPSNPKHRLLRQSFLNWYNDVKMKYSDDLIIDMLRETETEIEYGEVR